MLHNIYWKSFYGQAIDCGQAIDRQVIGRQVIYGCAGLAMVRHTWRLPTIAHFPGSATDPSPGEGLLAPTGASSGQGCQMA